MADADILLCVSRALRDIAQNRLKGFSPRVHLGFGSPADEDTTALPKLLVYLYCVTDNAFLKNAEPEIPSVDVGPDGRIQVDYLTTYGQPPTGVDLHYMFVPYAQNPEVELQIICCIKQLFAYGYMLESPYLKDEAVKKILQQHQNSALQVIPDDLSMEEVHRIWGGCPDQNYKLSLFYVVTPVRIPSILTGTATRVTEIYDQSYAD